MAELNKHWTEQSTDDFLYRLGSDFVSRIGDVLGKISKSALAKKLGVTAGRISQVLNNPGNLRLRTMIEYARALGLKIAVVVYDDNDPKNSNGPIDAEIFEKCWIRAGRPRDFFALEASAPKTSDQFIYVIRPQIQGAVFPDTFRQLESGIEDTADNSSQFISKWQVLNKGGFYGGSNTNRI